MTANDIRSQRFGAQLLRGLNSEEVSAFLEGVAEAYDDVQNTNRALTVRVMALEAEILALAARKTQVVPPPEVLHDAEAQGVSTIKGTKEKEMPASSHIEVLRAVALQEIEALLHDARAQAQTLINGAQEAAALANVEVAKAQRQREADDLMAEARSRAHSLIVAAREQETAIRDEIERLSQRRLQLVDDVRTTLDTYDQWLETVDPRGRAPGRREHRMVAARAAASPDEVSAG
jgi:DivIVA domain-containing protein